MKITPTEFDKLALEHLDMLFRVARRLTRNAAAAEDLVQDTYLRAFRARAGFELEQYGIRPWLVRIMHNLHMTRSGREKRQPAPMDDSQLDDAASPFQAPQTLPAVDRFEGMDQELVHAVNELSAEYQTVLLLWAIEDFSYKEIAAALEIPLGTVMSRLYRARTKLSETLRDFAREEGIIRE